MSINYFIWRLMIWNFACGDHRYRYNVWSISTAEFTRGLKGRSRMLIHSPWREHFHVDATWICMITLPSSNMFIHLMHRITKNFIDFQRISDKVKFRCSISSFCFVIILYMIYIHISFFFFLIIRVKSIQIMNIWASEVRGRNQCFVKIASSLDS